jgi:hypothetical protein
MCAGMLGLAGCTEGSGTSLGGGSATAEPTTSASTAGGSGTGTASPTGTPGAGACDLLTAEDIAAVAGRQVGAPVARSVAGASICQYDGIVVTRLQSSVTAAQFDQTVGKVASAVQGQVKAVDGIGDAAAYIPLLKEICVVREPTFFCIAGFEQPQAEQLAERAVARL